ncbi:MAG: hypothetical protein WCE35_25260 [Bradyrhizobium sp.]
MRIVAAALLYSAIVFAVGLALGPIRVLWLEPAVGRVLAEICEAPFLLIAMVFASRWVPSVLHLRRDLASLGMMGLGALAIQQGADLAVGIYLRGINPAEQLANYATGAGLIYAGLLLVFAAMPILVSRDTAPAGARR